MSVSELFNHGQAHPTANMRFNNVTIDGATTIIMPNNPITPTLGATITTFSGTVRITTTLINTLFSYPIPSSPPNVAISSTYTFYIKGGAPGATNNVLVRQDRATICRTNGVLNALSSGFGGYEALDGFGAGIVISTTAVAGNNINYTIQNTAVGQTIDVVWYVKIKQMTTDL